MQEEKLTNHTMATILEVSDRRADQIANAGLLPFEIVSMGNRQIRIFKRSDVEAFKQKREAEKGKKNAQSQSQQAA